MIALDCETTGLDVFHGARPFFVTICQQGDDPIGWEWQVDPLTRKVKKLLADVYEIRKAVKDADRIVGQNIKFDVAMLREAGIVEDWPWHKTEDTLIAGHLLKSNQAHDLTTMALVYLGVNILPYEVELKKAVQKCRNMVRRQYPDWRIAKKGLPEMPSVKDKSWGADMWLPRAVADEQELHAGHPYRRLLRDYSNADSAVTMHLWTRMEKLLKKQGLWEIYRERMKAVPVAVEMERRGITVSGERLEEQVETYSRESIKSGEKCVSIAKTFDYDLVLPKSGNNHSLTKFCFEAMELPPVKKSAKTGVPSLDKDTVDTYLATLRPGSKQHRFVQELSDKRKRDTAVGYMNSYSSYWMDMGNSWFVLHPSLNPTGTYTLRWSSSNPNEQNISKKEGFNLRYAFGPAPGREWWSLDYENIELRIPAYESGERVMIDLFERPDDPPYFGSYHLLNASIVYPDLFWPLAEKKGVFKDKYKANWYQYCKNGGFAIQYGCQEAKADATFRKRGAYREIKEKMPKVAELNDYYVNYANKHGYVETLPDKSIGTERGYPIWCTRSSWGGVSPTIPFNYHIQSTAMWCTTKAMPRLHDYLKTLGDHHLAMQVHDECVFDFPAGGKANLPKVQRLAKIMEKSGDDVGIPLKVSISYHPENWSDEGKP